MEAILVQIKIIFLRSVARLFSWSLTQSVARSVTLHSLAGLFACLLSCALVFPVFSFTKSLYFLPFFLPPSLPPSLPFFLPSFLSSSLPFSFLFTFFLSFLFHLFIYLFIRLFITVGTIKIRKQ